MDAPEPGQTALEQIPNSRVDFRPILDSMPTLAWFRLPGRSADYFQRWSEYTGLLIQGLFESGWKSAIHPDDLAALAKWDTVDITARDSECQVRLRRFDGSFRWFAFRREPLCDEAGSVVRWFGTGIDLDDAKQRDALHAGNDRRWCVPAARVKPVVRFHRRSSCAIGHDDSAHGRRRNAALARWRSTYATRMDRGGYPRSGGIRCGFMRHRGVLERAR